MKYDLIDTDTLSFFLKGNLRISQEMTASIRRSRGLSISVVTHYEVLHG